jgi:hypothetical protein
MALSGGFREFCSDCIQPRPAKSAGEALADRSLATAARARRSPPFERTTRKPRRGSLHGRLLSFLPGTPGADLRAYDGASRIAVALAAADNPTRNEWTSGPTAGPRCAEWNIEENSTASSRASIWKWSIPALVGQTKSGKAQNHAAGVKAAQQAIEKALAPKKQRLRRPA